MPAARAMVIFDRQGGGSWLPTTVILATPDRLQGRCLPGDENRDGRLALLLDHAIPPQVDVGSATRGTYEDWIGWAVNHLANGHTTWTAEVAPALTIDDLFEREMLGVVSAAPRRWDPGPNLTIDEARTCLSRIQRAVKYRDEDAAPGCADDTARTVSENARTLRLRESAEV